MRKLDAIFRWIFFYLLVTMHFPSSNGGVLLLRHGMLAFVLPNCHRATTSATQNVRKCIFPRRRSVPSEDTYVSVRNERYFSLTKFVASSSSHSQLDGLYMSSIDDNNGDSDDDVATEESERAIDKTLDSTWDVVGLKKEVHRLSQRCFKKIGRANQRLTKAKEMVTELTVDATATVEALENCPSLAIHEKELQNLQQRMRHLNTLNDALTKFTKKDSAVVLPPEIAQLALELKVNDQPPTRPARVPKSKGPKHEVSIRKPYRRYYSYNNTEIRVGKGAQDNDVVSTMPEHRDNWWMHASGCPGSHVVIRYQSTNLPPDDVLSDAAALAARQSKCTGSVIHVSLTRCRDVKKPPGAKAGLVLLTGNVRTIAVDMKKAEERLKRLEETVIVN